MPTTGSGAGWFRRWGPELALGVLAGCVFLGFLGSVDLWGKREQRASAEAIDTVDHQHWLVARIQGRPRLEKPPLPRWTIAALMTATGRRDEWVVRLPAALSALGMVALCYAFGRGLAGRSAGLAAGLTLCSTGFFISEMRQSGNDGPLAFFTTLALYAAWRRLHAPDGALVGDTEAQAAGGRGWSILFHAALGLGFLCKGPIALVLALMTIVPYLLCARRLGVGLRRLADGWGLLVFALLALSWPVPVLLNDPNALRLWMLEMGQKAGTAGIAHRSRTPLAADWPWMTLPWAVLATTGAVLPLLPNRGAAFRPRIWFPWWWSVGNLAMFCVWSVAKPNYFLPCIPGAAVLVGMEWVRMTRMARTADAAGTIARRLLQSHWVVLFVGAAVLPVVMGQVKPTWLGGSLVFALAMTGGVVASAWLWRRGADAGALAPLAGAVAIGVLVGYGRLAPLENDRRSHRELAAALERTLPPEARTVMFFHEIDEGLWFYLHDRELTAVPGSQPVYNDAFRLAEDLKHGRLEFDDAKRGAAQMRILFDWLRLPEHPSRYVLMLRKRYEPFAAELAPLAEPLYVEQDKRRNEVVLLRVRGSDPTPAVAGPVGDATRRQ